jgi:hypothetical protein
MWKQFARTDKLIAIGCEIAGQREFFSKTLDNRFRYVYGGCTESVCKFSPAFLPSLCEVTASDRIVNLLLLPFIGSQRQSVGNTLLRHFDVVCEGGFATRKVVCTTCSILGEDS